MKISKQLIALLIVIAISFIPGCYPVYEPYPTVQDRVLNFKQVPSQVQDAFLRQYPHVEITSIMERSFKKVVTGYRFDVVSPLGQKLSIAVRTEGTVVKDVRLISP